MIFFRQGLPHLRHSGCIQWLPILIQLKLFKDKELMELILNCCTETPVANKVA
jgi:hypothetical protein